MTNVWLLSRLYPFLRVLTGRFWINNNNNQRSFLTSSARVNNFTICSVCAWQRSNSMMWRLNVRGVIQKNDHCEDKAGTCVFSSCTCIIIMMYSVVMCFLNLRTTLFSGKALALKQRKDRLQSFIQWMLVLVCSIFIYSICWYIMITSFLSISLSTDTLFQLKVCICPK